MINLIKQTISNYVVLYKYWGLISFMAKQRRKSSIVQTMLGSIWLVIEPLMEMIVYYFIVVIIFKRGSGYGVNPFLFIMLGIVHFRFLHKVINMGANAVTASQSFLQQLLIEPLIFITISFYQAILDFRIALTLYLVLLLIIEGNLSSNIFYYPLILFVLILLAWPLGILMGSLTVFFRDLPMIVNMMMRLLLYGSAIFYPITFVPERYREVFLYNPVAYIFAVIQWSLLNTPKPPIEPLFSLVIFVVFVFFASHFVYNTTKRKFTKYL